MPSPKIKKNAVVLTARELLKGYVADSNASSLYNMIPIQFITMDEKDEEWKKWNLDWLERVGMRQVGRDASRMIKNYHLANGILDKGDYVIGPDNQMSDVVSNVVLDNTNTIPLKFFPIVPSIVKLLIGEFSKRDNRIIAYAVDNYTQTEQDEYKLNQVQDILVQNAQRQKLMTLQSMGINFDDPESQQQIAQEMDLTKQLAEAQVKYKNYRSIPEQWANHVIQVDTERFDMYQQEITGFRDLLVTDKEFWHINVKEDDYSIELWNPVNTFYHKSPDTRYVSQGNYVGRILMMSIADVIDIYGSKMTEDQLISLKDGHRVVSGLPLVTDAYKDQTNWYTNYSKPYPNNITNVTWGQYMDGKFMQSMQNPTNPSNNSFDYNWYDVSKMSPDYFSSMDSPGMVRVTEAYWKSQRRIGWLTRITEENGEKEKMRVDENFKVTFKPVYDKSIHQKEAADNLIFGEHIDWTQINEVRYGVKINSALSTFYARNYNSFEPIYIGGDPIPFQFKAEEDLYGASLPVEGIIASDRNSHAYSFVDQTKSFQVVFNIVNNQILELLADDIGNVIVIDQNMIPRNSLGGEWGKHNFPMFYQVMKDYKLAALDPSIRNTENTTNFQHFQSVDMSTTNQIITRIKIAEWAKEQAFQVVGIQPQRVGSIAASESATGVRTATNNSYAQTESFFDVHMNHLMPRVRQMSLDAAQFITATKPTSRLAYMNRDEEKVFFEIEGYRLLLRDFRIKAKSTADIKELLSKLERLAMENNTAGGSLYEISHMLTMQSPAEIIAKLKEADDKRAQEVQAQRDHEMQIQQMQQEAIEKQGEREDYWKGKTLEKDILVAQIRASQSKSNDVNADSIPDPLEALSILNDQSMTAAQILDLQENRTFQKKVHDDNLKDKDQDRQLKREEMQSKEKIENVKAKVQMLNPVSGEKKPRKK